MGLSGQFTIQLGWQKQLVYGGQWSGPKSVVARSRLQNDASRDRRFRTIPNPWLSRGGTTEKLAAGFCRLRCLRRFAPCVRETKSSQHKFGYDKLVRVRLKSNRSHVFVADVNHWAFNRIDYIAVEQNGIRLQLKTVGTLDCGSG